MQITKLQRRDLQALEELNPDYGFEEAYLAHLQDYQQILVASHKDDEGLRTYFGYACIIWESEYTPFWRHNIPEIVDLYVVEKYQQQGTGLELIKGIEGACIKKGFRKIGIRITQEGEFATIRDFYQMLGYEEKNTEEKVIIMVKSLI